MTVREYNKYLNKVRKNTPKIKTINTYKEFKVKIGGTKEDYIIYNDKIIERKIKQLEKKANKKIISLGIEFYTPKTGDFNYNKNIKNLEKYSTILDDRFFKGEISKTQKQKMFTTDYTGEVLSAGLYVGGKPATLKTFKGDRLALAYNNYLIAINNLGYNRLLKNLKNMTPQHWNTIYKKNKSVLAPVFKYRYFEYESDEDYFIELYEG